MWISVRTRRCSISARRRQSLERYLRRALEHDRDRIASVVVYLQPAQKRRDDIEYAARIVVWSSSLGQIAANETHSSIRVAVGQATRRVRRSLRERVRQKRNYGRLATHFAILEKDRGELLERELSSEAL